MKIQIIIFLSLIIISLGCQLDKDTPATKEEKERIRRLKPPGKYYTDFDNEECKQQINSAKIDVKNGKLLYEDPRGWVIIRYDEEMEEILGEYGIDYEMTGPNCTLEQECYGYYMDSVINEKYGLKFIKQIQKRADSLFLSRWRTKTYASWDIDIKPSLKNDDAEVYLERRIKFPKNWDTIPMEFERQYVSINVVISNEGKLVKWEHGEMYNLKKSNEQFLPEIQQQISQIMKNMKDWHPGKLEGKKVNSKSWLDVNLDK